MHPASSRANRRRAALFATLLLTPGDLAFVALEPAPEHEPEPKPELGLELEADPARPLGVWAAVAVAGLEAEAELEPLEPVLLVSSCSLEPPTPIGSMGTLIPLERKMPIVASLSSNGCSTTALSFPGRSSIT
jgi:hypothetical protein